MADDTRSPETRPSPTPWNTGKLTGPHPPRRTKATLIYRRTKNLRAVQLLLGYRKLESTVRHLGVEVEASLKISEQAELQGLARRGESPSKR